MESNKSWLDSLHSKLDSYSEELPKGGWDRLERALEEKKRKKILWFRPNKGWAAAAAAILFAVFPTSLIEEKGSHIPQRFAAVNGTSGKYQATTQQTVKDQLSQGATSQPMAANQIGGPKMVVNQPSIQPIIAKVTTEYTPYNPSHATAVADSTTGTRQRQPSSTDSLGKKMVTIDDILLAEAIDNATKSPQSRNRMLLGAVAVVASSSRSGSEQETYAQTSEIFGSNANNLLFVQPDRIKHHTPLSFGLTLSKPIGKRLSVEAALVYTYLTADIYKYGISNSEKQKQHYLGIPLGLKYGVYTSRYFEAYLGAGAMVEVCVAGKITQSGSTKKVDAREKRPQYSVAGSVGLQYNITPRVGLYFEPFVGYYFNNGSAATNIYKDEPLGVRFRVGVRVGI